MADGSVSSPPDDARQQSDRQQTEENGTVEETGGSETGRLGVLKTYKLYLGGAFPRSESGRTDRLNGPDGRALANVCRASRKDLREAVEAARAAQGGWAGRSAYNRSQILYRIAEMLEGRAAQFAEELRLQGETEEESRREVAATVDRLVYYAGWADKLQQVFGAVNPVASSHFNFSLLEPTGVVAAVAPRQRGLLGLVSLIAPAIVCGNTVVVLASPERPLSSVTFAEVLHSSDVPGGVVNVLTGRRDELVPHVASHMDVNALVLGEPLEGMEELRRAAAANVKRFFCRRQNDWFDTACETPYWILDTQEVKTTWHPVGI